MSIWHHQLSLYVLHCFFYLFQGWCHSSLLAVGIGSSLCFCSCSLCWTFLCYVTFVFTLATGKVLGVVCHVCIGITCNCWGHCGLMLQFHIWILDLILQGLDLSLHGFDLRIYFLVLQCNPLGVLYLHQGQILNGYHGKYLIQVSLPSCASLWILMLSTLNASILVSKKQDAQISGRSCGISVVLSFCWCNYRCSRSWWQFWQHSCQVPERCWGSLSLASVPSQ